MRILIHDYAGHPFPVTLSRELARRGHDVRHAYSSVYVGPKGALDPQPGDPAGLKIVPLSLPEYDKNNYLARRAHDVAHGRLFLSLAEQFRPDVVLCGNTGLDALAPTLEWCRKHDRRFVFWVQDLIGQAATRIFRNRLPGVGGLLGGMVQKFEHRLLRRSHAVVVISEDFRDHLPSGTGPVHVIENWASLSDIPMRSKDNGWTRAHGLAETTNFIYSGTIGRKHNPELLLQLADRVKARPEARVVVVSAGEAYDFLKAEAPKRSLTNMAFFPLQPIEVLPDVLGGADVLTAILEPDAGVFSVPSKVLSCLCAGRAVLLAVPPENLAARIVAREEAGLV
ncbi:MAG: glycosyltransferase family 4 protein, partial [Fimbriimonadaceae bacterium]|nr:glycosyltransferase family 4 protein [Fimbriimonadaceae bacterium]